MTGRLTHLSEPTLEIRSCDLETRRGDMSGGTAEEDTPVRLFVYAGSLASGGGLSVGFNFLREAADLTGIEIHAVVPRGVGYEHLQSGSLRLTVLSRACRSPVVRPFVERFLLPRLARRFRADVVFSMGNIALSVALPQLLLFHWSYAVYPDNAAWRRMSIQERMWRRLRLMAFQYQLKHATAVAVQTETVRARFRRIYGAKQLFVVPNAVPEEFLKQTGPAYRSAGETRRPRTFLCFTRYYVHKNLEVLLAVGELIRLNRLPFAITVTIAADQHWRARDFLSEVDRRGLGSYIINRGPVDRSDIEALYEKSDALLLPTLLESFSGTYLEAMAFGKPILTSDRDFARDVCGDAAVYFEPLDAESILRAMIALHRSPELVASLTEKGFARLRGMPGWRTVARIYLHLLTKIASA